MNRVDEGAVRNRVRERNRSGEAGPPRRVFDPPRRRRPDEITEQAGCAGLKRYRNDRFTLADECDHERLFNQCAVVERVGRVSQGEAPFRAVPISPKPTT